MMREMSRLLLSVNSERDMMQLLYRLFTPSEVVMIGRRMQIGELLVNGWSYSSIREKLGVGNATLRSVDSWLEHIMHDYVELRGKRKRIHNAAKRKKFVREWAQFGSFDHIRRKYPLHFLLVNLMLDSPTKSFSTRTRSKKSAR